MRKYNLSRIMKTAWTIKKVTSGTTFSECLKIAWKNEKDGTYYREPAKKTVVKKHIQITEVAKWVLRKMDSVSFMALDAGIAVNDIILEKETMKAIQISTEWDGYGKMLWLPKSACTYKFA